jgi:hypothetical protein
MKNPALAGFFFACDLVEFPDARAPVPRPAGCADDFGQDVFMGRMGQTLQVMCLGPVAVTACWL